MEDAPLWGVPDSATGDIPSWEVERAVRLLISALDDPSPRVREYAGVGLAELGPRAGQAASKLIAVLIAPRPCTLRVPDIGPYDRTRAAYRAIGPDGLTVSEARSP